MKTKTKFGFYVREISSVVAAVLMTAVNETIAFIASATRFLTASSEQYVASEKNNFTNNHKSLNSVYLTFSRLYQKIHIATYLRFYGNLKRILWTIPYYTANFL